MVRTTTVVLLASFLAGTGASPAVALQAGGVEIGDLETGSVIGEPFEELFCPGTPANPVKFVGLEVTQSIQRMGVVDPSPTHPDNNQVPLIAHKKTIARAYFDYVPPGPLLSILCAIDGTLTGTRNGAQVGTPLPSLNRAYLSHLQNGDLYAKRKTLLRSLNFELPQDWVTEGTLSLTVQITRKNGQPIPCAGCTTSVTVSFKPPKPLRVRLVKLIEEDRNGDLAEPTETDTGLIKSWLNRAFPIPNLPGPNPALWNVPIGEDRWYVNNCVEDSCPEIWDYQGFFISLSIYRVSALVAGMDSRTRLVGLFSNRSRGLGGASYDTVPAGSSDYTIPVVVPTGPTIPSDWPSFTDPSWDSDGSYADWYTGHELAHTFGFRHLKHCNALAASSEPAFDLDPYFGWISDNEQTYIGFDVGHIGPPVPGTNVSELKMKPLPGSIWHDLRTYCSHRWISPQMYKGVMELLATEDVLSIIASNSPIESHSTRVGQQKAPGESLGPAHDLELRQKLASCATVMEDRQNSFLFRIATTPEQHGCSKEKSLSVNVHKGDYLAIVASVNLTKKEGEFHWTSRVSRAEVQPDVTNPDAILQLIGENDEVLVEKAVLVERYTTPRRNKDNQGIIRDALELPPNKTPTALRLFIVGEKQPVAEMPIHKGSLPAPSVKVDLVNTGALAGGIRLSWETVGDFDKKTLTYSVQISFDQGKTWQTLAAGRRRLTLALTAKRIAELRPKGVTEALIRVTANDGFNTSYSDQEVVLNNPQN